MSVTCVSTGRVVSTRHDLRAEDRPLMSSSVEELAGGEWEVTVVLWDGRPRRVATFTHPGEAVTACNIAARVLGMMP